MDDTFLVDRTVYFYACCKS